MKSLRDFIVEGANYTATNFTRDLKTWGVEVKNIENKKGFQLINLKAPYDKIIVEFKADINVVVYDENYSELMSVSISRQYQSVGRTVAEFLKTEL